MIHRMIVLISFLSTSFFLHGCLLFHKVSYEVNLETEKTGTVKVLVEDIRSNAENTTELNEDKDILFRFLENSEDFIYQMEQEGKNIYSREYSVVDNKLNGIIEYSFDDINKVESIVYDEPFYYLTLALEDSVISTNGEIVYSEGHKRIIWDNSTNVLKFSMFGEDTSDKKLVSMAQHYKSGK